MEFTADLEFTAELTEQGLGAAFGRLDTARFAHPRPSLDDPGVTFGPARVSISLTLDAPEAVDAALAAHAFAQTVLGSPDDATCYLSSFRAVPAESGPDDLAAHESG